MQTKTAARSRSGSLRPGDCEWRLPSGEDLISFALAGGLAAVPMESLVAGRGGMEAGVADIAAAWEDWRRS